MHFQFQDKLIEWIGNRELGHVNKIDIDICSSCFNGDLTINCYVLAKQLKANPFILANQIADFLNKCDDIEKAEAVKAFVNLTLTGSAVMRDTIANEKSLLDSVKLPETETRKILIEFSAPNTNKPQHLGHVRNNTVGMATASILERVGHNVIRVNLVNDRGIHICKSMLAYQRFGNGTDPVKAGKKGDHLVGDFYVAYDKALREQIQALKDANPALKDVDNDELFLQTEIGASAQSMLKAWEDGEPETRKLWSRMNQWVFDGFAETYRRMGIKFEKTYLESQTYMLGKDIIQDGYQKGVFKKREDGAMIIEFDDKSLGTKVVLRSDGTSVYVTQDIGTTLLKQRDFQPDQQIWVVGDEQIRHFKVLFSILKALGYSWVDKLTHMAYGMVNLPSGKMKSREGTVVDADDLFDEMEELARMATLEKAGDNPPDNLDERAAVISMAALKFMLLKVNPSTTIMFDPNAAIKFEGDTGPYILYAYARISSMMRKAGNVLLDADVDWSLLSTDVEKKLAIRCALYPVAVQKAASKLDSSILASYLLDISKDFNTFYSKCSVLNSENNKTRIARLALIKVVRDIIGDGLNTLTIETLKSM